MTTDWTGKHILLTGMNYWPEESGNSPYTTGLAEHLAASGARVTVITGMPYYPAWKVAPAYAGKAFLTETHNGVTIHRLRQYVPTRQSAARRALVEASFMANVLRLPTMSRPDVVVGVMPAVCGGAMALAAAKRLRVPYGVIVQDLSGEGAAQTGISGGSRVAGITSSIESVILRNSSGVAIIAEGFKPHIEKMGVPADRIFRVRNWTHISTPTEDRQSTRTRLGFNDDEWIALHAGNMGFKQGLENVIDAAKVSLNRGDGVTYVFVGDGNQRVQLLEHAEKLPNVRFFPPQSEAEFPNYLAAADTLLVNQRPTIVDMCLPGKLTSYLSVERPVVAAVADTSDTAIELSRQEAGLVVPPGDPEALATAISSLRSDTDYGALIAMQGKRFADRELTASSALDGLEHFIRSTMTAQ